jgi:hypothetical protein
MHRLYIEKPIPIPVPFGAGIFLYVWLKYFCVSLKYQQAFFLIEKSDILYNLRKVSRLPFQRGGISTNFCL